MKIIREDLVHCIHISKASLFKYDYQSICTILNITTDTSIRPSKIIIRTVSYYLNDVTNNKINCQH